MTVTDHPGDEPKAAFSGEANEFIREYSTQVIREREIHLREDFEDPVQQRAFCVTHAVSLMNGLHLWKDKDEHIVSAKQTVEIAAIFHEYLTTGEVPPAPVAEASAG